MWNQLRKTANEKQPWKMTREELIGDNPPVDNFARNWNEDEFIYSRPIQGDVSEIIHEGNFRKMHWGGQTKMVKNQYAISQDQDYDRYLLMQRAIDDGENILMDWSPVGEYRHGNIGIMEAYRGEGAGTAFIQKLMEIGEWKPSIGYSPEGLKSADKAYERMVEKYKNE